MFSSGGFTLIELLVVICVIGIIAALLFPAVNAARQRAWNTKARDLCIQVANAWSTLQINNRRFPSTDLISSHAGTTKTVGGDICFQMTPEACSLLNWWTPKNPLPKFDKDNYESYLKRVGVDSKMSWKDIDDLKWPNDSYLERDYDQKKWGMIAPWLQRRINTAAEQGSAYSEGGLSSKELEAGCVWVILDTNGDGKITLSDSLGLGTAAYDEDGNSLVLNKSAVAWIFSDIDKSSALTSW